MTSPDLATTVAPLTPSELEPFCYRYPDERGRMFRRPWTHGGLTFATDGFVLVWIPALAAVPELDGFPTLEAILIDYPTPPAQEFSAQLPSWVSALEEWNRCEKCSGTGRAASEVCEDCNGEGRVPNLERHVVGIRLLAACFLVRLSRLPGLRLAADTGDPLKPLHFRFDGEGYGMLMPMSASQDSPSDPQRAASIQSGSSAA